MALVSAMEYWSRERFFRQFLHCCCKYFDCGRVGAVLVESFGIFGVIVGIEVTAWVLGEELFGSFYGVVPLLHARVVEHAQTLHHKVVGLGGEELVGYFQRFGVFVAEVQQHRVAGFVLREVVGVLDVLAILLGGFVPVIGVVVFSASSR